jgi:hypothetical protein
MAVTPGPAWVIFFHVFSPADTAPLIAAPLAGETIPAGVFILARFTDRHIDHSLIVWQYLERHFYSL